MILRIEKIGLSIEADDEFLKSLFEKGKNYYPNEFGGFLVGYYSENSEHLYITDTILPTSFKTSKYNFERSTNGIKKKLDAYFEENPKKIYVGEWHTHPDNIPAPSLTNISAINAIVKNLNAFLPNPVLLIIGYSKTQVDFGFYVWFENKMYKYE